MLVKRFKYFLISFVIAWIISLLGVTSQGKAFFILYLIIPTIVLVHFAREQLKKNEISKDEFQKILIHYGVVKIFIIILAVVATLFFLIFKWLFHWNFLNFFIFYELFEFIATLLKVRE